MTPTTITPDEATITEKTFDHGVDALCAISIATTATMGVADATVVGGLVTIALGKRVVGGRR